jgi:LacI family transcriptional regulator
MEFDPSLLINSNFHIDGGYRVVKDAVEAGVEFDAVLSNDEMACGAMKALNEAGISVPVDVSVVGFDGLPLGEAVSPTLTTIAVDRKRMASLAVGRMLSVSPDGGSEEHQKTTIFPRLVLRESCGALLRGNPTGEE